MNRKTTDELLKILNSLNTSSELETFTQNKLHTNTKQSFSDYLTECLATSDLTPSQLIQSAQIQRNYGYQILNGTKKPGRDKVLSLCLALKLSLSEVQRALTIAQEGALYPKNKRDTILIFCINNHMSVLETNDLLYQFDETLL